MRNGCPFIPFLKQNSRHTTKCGNNNANPFTINVATFQMPETKQKFMKTIKIISTLSPFFCKKFYTHTRTEARNTLLKRILAKEGYRSHLNTKLQYHYEQIQCHYEQIRLLFIVRQTDRHTGTQMRFDLCLHSCYWQ